MENDAGHTITDFEDIPPRPPTPSQMAATSVVSALLGIFDHYGIPYTEEPGWRTRQEGYNWYEGAPFGVMVHHTVSVPYGARSAYPAPEGKRTDGKVICNFLVQPDGVINCIAAGPANYSSGLNAEYVKDDYVLQDVRFNGPQSGPLGPEWYGNRAWINIETVHSGDGGPIPQIQENAVIALCASLCYLFGWSAWRVIGHLDGRGTKIDPRWDGEYSTPPYSIAGIQDKVDEILRDGLPPNTGGSDMWAEWVEGLVEGWAEDPVKTEDEFTRLQAEGKLGGSIDYWINLLDDPASPEWLGMVSRTFLSSW